MTYNQIRFIKKFLAVALVCFGTLVAYQLYVALDKRQTTSTAEIPLSNEPDARGVEMTRLDSEGEREFVLKAAESTGSTEDSQDFRDVEIRFEAGKEEVPLIITAETCRFDHQASAAHLEGNVVIRDEGSLRIETSVLDFVRQPDRAWTDEPVRFYRDDLEGKSGSLYYDVPASTFHLENSVSMTLDRGEGPVDIDSSSAVYRRPKTLMQFVDDVVVSQEDRRLRCNDLQIYLTEDEGGIERIEAYENVELLLNTASKQDDTSAASTPEAGGDSSEDEGNRIRVLEEPGSKRLLTDKLEVLFREDGGTLERMRAMDGGKLVFESQPASPSEPVMTRELEGHLLAFDFDDEGQLVELRGRGGITLTIRPKDGPPDETKLVTARQFEAEFDPDSGDLVRARCIKSVEFSQGDIRGTAELGVYETGTETLTLTESPQLWDSRAKLGAETIRIQVETGDLEAIRNVRSTMNEDSSGVFPSGENEPVHFVADRMVYDQATDQAIYTGSARGFQSENRVEGNRIELRQQKGEIEAEGEVRTVLLQTTEGEDKPQHTVTRAEHFTYRSEEDILRYRRNVVMDTEGLTLTGQRIDVTLDSEGEGVQEIEAEGEVVIESEEGRAQGNLAKYLPKNEEVHVIGDKASLQNGDKLTEGKELTFFLSNDKIFVDGQELSRTKSTYASKPRPF